MTKRARDYLRMRRSGWTRAAARSLVDTVRPTEMEPLLTDHDIDILREALKRKPPVATSMKRPKVADPIPADDPELIVIRRKRLEASIQVTQGHRCAAYVKTVGPRTRETRWNLYAVNTAGLSQKQRATVEPHAETIIRDVPVKTARKTSDKGNRKEVEEE